MYRICIVTTVSITLKAFVLDLAKAMAQTGDYEIHFVCNHDPEFAALLPDYIFYHPIAMDRAYLWGASRPRGRCIACSKKKNSI